MNTIGMAIFLLCLSSIFLWHIEHNRTTIVVHLGMLAFTPWFLTLLLGTPSISATLGGNALMPAISKNISFLTSSEFLFFTGDGRPGYGTSDHGMFLLSFMPLLFIGMYDSLISKKPGDKLTLWWALVGLTLATLFGRAPGLPAALWYLPALSIIATHGISKLIPICLDNLHRLPSTTTLQCMAVITLISGNFLWLMYEAIRLYHVILIHKPFSL